MAMNLRSLKAMRNFNNCFHQVSQHGVCLSISKETYNVDHFSRGPDCLISVLVKKFNYLGYEFTFKIAEVDNRYYQAGEICSAGWKMLDCKEV